MPAVFDADQVMVNVLPRFAFSPPFGEITWTKGGGAFEGGTRVARMTDESLDDGPAPTVTYIKIVPPGS